MRDQSAMYSDFLRGLPRGIGAGRERERENERDVGRRMEGGGDTVWFMTSGL